MKRQHKILFRNAPKSIRKAFCAPSAERWVMNYDVKVNQHVKVRD